MLNNFKKIILLICAGGIHISLAQVPLDQTRSEQVLSFVDEMVWGASVDFFMEFGGSQLDALITEFQSRWDYHWNPSMSFNAEVLFSASKEGTSQKLYLRKSGKNQGLEILSLYTAWTARPEDYNFSSVWSGLELETQFGIINQAYLSAPLLISKRGFIGLKEELTWDHYTSQYFDQARLIFQQSWPSSQTDVNFIQQFRDKTWLFTGSLFLEKSYEEMIFTKGNFTGFYFKSLSPETAKQGSVLGNEVYRSRTGADSNFPFPFYGIYTSLEVYLDLFKELDVELGTSFLWNLGEFEALKSKQDIFKISKKNKAQSFFIKFHIPFFKDVRLIPSVEYFVSQSNASPAFYNTAQYGHSNRHGYITTAKFEFEKYKFYVDVRYGALLAISKKDKTGNVNYISFSIGREYESQI